MNVPSLFVLAAGLLPCLRSLQQPAAQLHRQWLSGQAIELAPLSPLRLTARQGPCLLSLLDGPGMSATVAVFFLVMERKPQLSVLEGAESFSISLLSILGASPAIKAMSRTPFPFTDPFATAVAPRNSRATAANPRCCSRSSVHSSKAPLPPSDLC